MHVNSDSVKTRIKYWAIMILEMSCIYIHGLEFQTASVWWELKTK